MFDKDKLYNTFINVGSTVWNIVVVLLVIAPFIVLKIPVWLAVIIMLVIFFSPGIGTVLDIGIWVWALVKCIMSVQSFWTVGFYILFALNIVASIPALYAPLLILFGFTVEGIGNLLTRKK